MISWDQSSLLLLLQNCYGSVKDDSIFSHKVLFYLRYVHFLFIAIEYLVDNSIVQKHLLHAPGNQKLHVPCFLVIAPSLQWSGTEPLQFQDISTVWLCCNVRFKSTDILSLKEKTELKSIFKQRWTGSHQNHKSITTQLNFCC